MIAPVSDIEPAPSFVEDAPDETTMPHSPPLTAARQDVSKKEAGGPVSTVVRPTAINPSLKIGTSHDSNVRRGNDGEPSVSTRRIQKCLLDFTYLL